MNETVKYTAVFFRRRICDNTGRLSMEKIGAIMLSLAASRIRLFVLVPVLILIAVCRAEPPGPIDVKIITPRQIFNIRGSVAATAAERAGFFREIPVVEDGACRLVVFPLEGRHPFVFDSGTRSADVLLISRNNRILRVIETVRKGRCYAASSPVIAIAVLPEGFCKGSGIATGHYIDTGDVSLSPVGRLKSDKDDIAVARSMMEKSLESFPDDPAVMEDLGDFYIGIHEFKAAKAIFERLRLQAPTADRLTRLAQITAAEGNWTEALQIIRQAIVLDPRSIRSYMLWLKMPATGQVAGSPAEEIRSVLDKDPDFNALRQELAEFHLKNNRLEEAQKLLNYSSTDEESNAGFQRIAGDILLRKGDFPGAAEAYRNYLHTFPYDPHAADLRVFITVHAFRKEALGL